MGSCNSFTVFSEITIMWCRAGFPTFCKTRLSREVEIIWDMTWKFPRPWEKPSPLRVEQRSSIIFSTDQTLQELPKKENRIFSSYTVCFPSHLLALSAGTKMLVWEKSCCNAVWRLNIKVSLKRQKRWWNVLLRFVSSFFSSSTKESTPRLPLAYSPTQHWSFWDHALFFSNLQISHWILIHKGHKSWMLQVFSRWIVNSQNSTLFFSSPTWTSKGRELKIASNYQCVLQWNFHQLK